MNTIAFARNWENPPKIYSSDIFIIQSSPANVCARPFMNILWESLCCVEIDQLKARYRKCQQVHLSLMIVWCTSYFRISSCFVLDSALLYLVMLEVSEIKTNHGHILYCLGTWHSTAKWLNFWKTLKYEKLPVLFLPWNVNFKKGRIHKQDNFQRILHGPHIQTKQHTTSSPKKPYLSLCSKHHNQTQLCNFLKYNMG